MKKRFFAVLLCLIAVMTLCVFPMTVSAEENGSETAEAVEAETSVVDEPTFQTPAPEPEMPVSGLPEASGEGEGRYHTLFTRIWEFVSTYSGETVSVASSFILLIINLVMKHANSKTKKTLDGINGTLGEASGSQKAVVNAVNNMIEGYNGLAERYDAMKESYDLYGATDGERNRVVGAVLATNTAILEILTTVYVNSKNLPQGVKDLINLKYANCLKSLGDDKSLIAIVEAVRDNISAAEKPTETTDTEKRTDADAENAEV